MALSYNGTSISTLKFNNTTISSLYYNGTLVYPSGWSVISGSFNSRSGSARLPSTSSRVEQITMVYYTTNPSITSIDAVEFVKSVNTYYLTESCLIQISISKDEDDNTVSFYISGDGGTELSYNIYYT